MRHVHKKRGEIPIHNFGDQQILWLANQGGDAAERSTDRTVHHQVSEEFTKPFQICAVQIDDFLIRGRIVIQIEFLARSNLVINTEKARSHGDDHGRYGQRVEERGQKRRGK